jgi:phage gp46-like protein
MDMGIFIVDGCFNLVFENGDFKADDGLETAVIISLWTDARADETELPDGIETKKGWWGDMFPVVEGDQIGSKIWLADRGKQTNDTLALLENFSREALLWMLEDGVAAQIETASEFNGRGQAITNIVITRPTGDQDKFAANWDSQDLVRA